MRALALHSSPREEQRGVLLQDSDTDPSEQWKTYGRRPTWPAWALAGCCALVAAGAGARASLRGSRRGPTRGAGFAVEAVIALDDESPTERYIRWKEYPDKCLDVWGDRAGAMVQLWTCNDFEGAGVAKETEFKWILPAVDVQGMIRWAGNSSLCLNAPEGEKVQLWYCDMAPVTHTTWNITSDGRIHLAYNFAKCLDIPNGDKSIRNGIKLQLWDCMEEGDTEQASNVIFDVYPQDCEWSEWSSWSACSAPCGGGSRYKARRFQKSAANGGKACVGPATRSDPCGDEPCLGEEGAEGTSEVASGTDAAGGIGPDGSSTTGQPSGAGDSSSGDAGSSADVATDADVPPDADGTGGADGSESVSTSTVGPDGTSSTGDFEGTSTGADAASSGAHTGGSSKDGLDASSDNGASVSETAGASGNETAGALSNETTGAEGSPSEGNASSVAGGNGTSGQAAAAARREPHVEYIGCFKNDPGSDHIEGHTPERTVIQCEELAGQGSRPYFGMEYPQGSNTTGNAECLPLEGLPRWTAPDSDCEGVPPVEGQRLGGAHRLAVYSRPESFCFRDGWKFLPLDMDGTSRTVEETSMACQARCEGKPGCKHFSWWRNGGCHLQDAAARPTEDHGSLSGPHICEASFAPQLIKKTSCSGLGCVFR